MSLPKDTLKQILKAQKNEITEYYIYKKLADSIDNEDNKKILQHIAQDELLHYEFWKNLTKKTVAPSKLIIIFYYILTRLFGLSFGLRLMEKGEELSQKTYKVLKKVDPNIEKIIQDENSHELKLIDMLDDNRLKYTGSIILGLNDALVELTGALAGFTFALQNTKIIAIVGLITGIAASMSMAGSEYLSTKEEGSKRNPFRASFFTGISYIITVVFLILPFFFLQNPFYALGLTIGIAIIIIIAFTFYTSVAKKLSFKRKFLEMTLISLGVAVISFGIGFIVNKYFL